MSANIPQEFNNFFLKDVSFVNLMTRRIFNVLIVANPYDAFMLEDDGHNINYPLYGGSQCFRAKNRHY